ncbi:kinesin-like protein cut7 [Schizosaccharomyces japonicus yFS275]|uniref:Kinesin-like protein cut7 n=1 Tax=Schizosaccharomyces japonicus (strain yFS275 / FY16936) TaxID=402676 RepID=B6JWJ7_SCHJY|nr:kinesin-like protein cut7 [Schizosaccharomyces japonicus yFS275]EEB05748.2 kinesin-like protein cut7 [Schizosaccharomyces japonicus yFS275]
MDKVPPSTSSISPASNSSTQKTHRETNAPAGKRDSTSQRRSGRVSKNHEPQSIKETSVQVVIRTRARNEREIKENGTIAISTFGAKGNEILAHTGPLLSNVGNKTYTFDRVYGPEADQAMVFEDTVIPMLDQVLNGFNCTIFAYGQTGTGKTYTMTGDISFKDKHLSHNAGIIPRSLAYLYEQLETHVKEFTVKCSFIELYNEELRDLLSFEEDKKNIKLYEDSSNKGSVVINGMEEVIVRNAAAGIDLLHAGSVRRQVAATKINDLSSRSHSIFMITIHMKLEGLTGEPLIKVGKLNLVDLAGSENVGKSGAENMRAREAGMINQSLLTLGRVIIALVERNQHIPYRESKLTRLLQDSLGGKTKTCIIATVSPSRSCLDETLSTLEYANRAKNIKNKSQCNVLLSPKMLIKDYVTEIERLRNDLAASRQKNGIFMAEETYKSITAENSSLKLLVDEQNRKIVSLNECLCETRLQNVELTRSSQTMKTNCESMQAELTEMNEKNSQLVADLMSVEDEHKQLQTKVEELQNENDRLRAQLSQSKQAYEASLKDVSFLQSSISQQQQLLEQMRKQFESHKKDLIVHANVLDDEFKKQQSHAAQRVKSHKQELTEWKNSFIELFDSVFHSFLDMLRSVDHSIKKSYPALHVNYEIVQTTLERSQTQLEGYWTAGSTMFAQLESLLGNILTGVNEGHDQLSTLIKSSFESCRSSLETQLELSKQLHKQHSLYTEQAKSHIKKYGKHFNNFSTNINAAVLRFGQDSTTQIQREQEELKSSIVTAVENVFSNLMKLPSSLTASISSTTQNSQQQFETLQAEFQQMNVSNEQHYDSLSENHNQLQRDTVERLQDHQNASLQQLSTISSQICKATNEANGFSSEMLLHQTENIKAIQSSLSGAREGSSSYDEITKQLFDKLYKETTDIAHLQHEADRVGDSVAKVDFLGQHHMDDWVEHDQKAQLRFQDLLEHYKQRLREASLPTSDSSDTTCYTTSQKRHRTFSEVILSPRKVDNPQKDAARVRVSCPPMKDILVNSNTEQPRLPSTFKQQPPAYPPAQYRHSTA